MEAKKICLDDYEYAGEGANGESYNLKSDSSVMMKLYNESADITSAINELELARKVYAAGIPTPKPGEFITDGNGRFGIQFERIVGKKSYSRATGDDPQNVEKYAREFAKMCKELHSIHLKKGDFEDQKEKDKRQIDENPYFTPEEKVKVKAFVDSVPDADTAIHGDLQFSNAIVADGKQYFIDLGDFAMGHPYFDLGMVMLCCLYETEEFSQGVFHMTCATAAEFWKYFVKGYFGEDADPDEWEKILKPYAGLKCLIIELYAGCYFPQYHALLDEITKS